MAKAKQIYICSKCSYQTSKWMGRCSECGEWNSFEERTVEEKTPSKSNPRVIEHQEAPMQLSAIGSEKCQRINSSINEFDRVVGGGLAKGSLVLIGGEPGIGKSTLVTMLLGEYARTNPKQTFLYISGEESKEQVADRARRLKISSSNLYIYHQTSWDAILQQIKERNPTLLVLDSIQTTAMDELSSAPGSVAQIREVTYQLMNYAKAKNITCFIIGHITKEGAIAGPKVLEHMVDTVVYFEGDQNGHYRILRAMKNRFGNTNEVGIFEMGESGLEQVVNPAQYFLDECSDNSYGRSLTCIQEGSRSLVVEIQSLVVENRFGNGRRTTQGIDSNRLAMLVAVIEKYYDLSLGFYDIYVNVVGGLKLTGRESDLAIIVSLLSSHKKEVMDNSTVWLGEVGLTGEVRNVPRLESRLSALEQLGYKHVLLPQKNVVRMEGSYNMEIKGITKIRELDRYLSQ